MSNRQPVRIRNDIYDCNDVYILDGSLKDNTVCKSCGSVYMSGRWYTRDEHPEAKNGEIRETHSIVCPGCRKLSDHVPGGLLKISGGFINNHRDEIFSLIRNESSDAHKDNPLELVMSIETVDEDIIEVATTNEKLAQKLGRSLHKAYGGDVEYKWSEGDRFARVNWHRE